jgi:hypothetical protein
MCNECRKASKMIQPASANPEGYEAAKYEVVHTLAIGDAVVVAKDIEGGDAEGMTGTIATTYADGPNPMYGVDLDGVDDGNPHFFMQCELRKLELGG